ncbi:MAG: YIP1 family protein [Armatimonadetes bacterium]|nr:YIP1 family protein [Armatimonadota bacterium]
MQEQNDHVQAEYDDPQEEYFEEEELSPFDRFVQVVTNPSRAFSGLLGGKGNMKVVWWGILVTLVVSIASVVMVSSRPEAIAQIKEQQMKQLDKAVEDGKMTQDQRDKAAEQMEAGMTPTVFLIFGVAGSVVMLFVLSIMCSLIWLAIAKYLEPNAHEGLTFQAVWATVMVSVMILNIGTIVGIVLLQFTGTLQTLSLAEVLKPESTMLQSALSVASPFNIWWLVVSAVGIGSLARASRLKAGLIWGVVLLMGAVLMGMVANIFTGMGAG